MFKRALSFLGIFFGMAMVASVGDVTPQRLGSINRNTTMYSASQVDELIKYKLEVPKITLLAYELRKKGMRIPECILNVKEFTDALSR